MSNFSLETSGGSSYPEDAYVLWVYPNSQDERAIVKDEVIYGPADYTYAGGLKHLCEQILSNGDIDGYSIYVYNSEPGLDDSVGYEEFNNKFGDWMKGKSFENYVGTHMCISDNISAGLADSPNHPSHSSAFEASKYGIAGTDWGSRDRSFVVPVHESLHTISNCALNNKASEDHYLGSMIYKSGDQLASPCGYDTTHWNNGDCTANTSNPDGWTSEMNFCEEVSVEETAKEAFN